MKLFGREPTLWLQLLSAVLGLLVTFQWDALTAENAALIVAATSAGFGLINAVLVRPIAPAAFTAFVAACASLLAGYGLDVSQEQVGMVQASVIAMLALVTRNQVAPVQPARSTDVAVR